MAKVNKFPVKKKTEKAFPKRIHFLTKTEVNFPEKIHFTSKMDMDSPRKIHIMGIGGSACSGVALIAKNQGYQVSGCDLENDTAYLNKIKKEKIKVKLGHNKNHLQNADLVVVSPAILYQNPDNPEVSEAKKRKKFLTWEEFLGKVLQNDKEVLCISGTHGKSTTTAMSGLVFEKSGLDPGVILGAKIKEWKSNFRVGKSGIFITEADEFNDNYLSYSPSAIILNNIEFDHPDYFKSFDQLLDSFEKFVTRLRGKRVLIVNQDDPGVRRLFQKMGKDKLRTFKLFGYTLSDKPLIELNNSARIYIRKSDRNGTEFSVGLGNHPLHKYHLAIPGSFNVVNAAGVIILAKIFKIPDHTIAGVLNKFTGIERRLELIGQRNGKKVYDDYAHHPTAIKATIKALRQKYPDNRVWVVDEPHSYSRTKALLEEYNGAFDQADKVIITPIFKARDKSNFGLKEDDLVSSSNHKSIIFLNTFDKISGLISREAAKGDIILVMGAGKSYQLARKILNDL